VVDELAWDPAVDSAAIGVTVSDGVVTLNGHVKTLAEKLAAEKAVRRIGGVKAVVDDLDVELAPSRKEDDNAIARAAINALNWNTSVPMNAVDVTVEHGWVKLEGSVVWFFQREAAENAVRYLKGVKGVSNLIVLRQPVSSPDLRSKIEAAFQRSARIDAERIKVVTSDGRVTLRGSVRSLAERESAEDAVWAAPGVTDVKNEIAVEGSLVGDWH
jgi:osmotically-inducible protein OsmY